MAITVREIHTMYVPSKYYCISVRRLNVATNLRRIPCGNKKIIKV